MRGRKALEFDEESTRISLINPFWEALGWDVRNPREVVHEKRVATRRGTKRADYCFNVRGRPAFVVEAKEAGKKLTDPDAVFQAKRYGYNLPVPVAILTDFEEFRPFKSALEPVYENPGRGLIKEFDLKYDQYLERWEDVYKTFSREAVYEGSLPKITGIGPRHKEALDRKFFERLTAWREELARVIALDNGDVGVHDLNEAVQRILDRIIFVRVIEDREIEPVELLQDAVNRWAREKEKPLYQYVTDVFRKLDPQYNGELFDRHFSEELLVRDKPLSDFIESLYYPLCPYQFNVIGVEMLGTIYERFLGSTIRLTPSHRAKVEEKPEVRKAGGVYYTPAYIVDYIVENTVGKLLEKCKTPRDVVKLKILDPACGSGSVLLGAFRRLIEWHEDYYNAHPEKISKPPKAECWLDKEHPDGPRYRLTARAKGRILVNNIYGVDIDPQAVEVTVMSLYLKVLEDVDAGLLMKTALLPPLESNIKCGNSLIGSDYWDFVRAEQGELFERTDEEERRVNPFDWDQEFPEVIKYKAGTRDLADGSGFDAVIGNPPYVRGGLIGDEKEYYIANYETFVSTGDLYLNFVEKALKLTKNGGRFSFIVSNKWMRVRYGEDLRKFVKNYQIEQLVDFGELKVFQDAATFPLVIIISKDKRTSKPVYAPIKRLDFEDFGEEVKSVGYELEDGAMADEGFSLITKDRLRLIEKMKAVGVPLGEYVDGKMYYGIKTGFNEAFIIDAETKDKLIKEDKKSAEIIKPFVVGDDVRKCRINYNDTYIILTKMGVPIKEYPVIFNRLEKYKRELENRRDQGKHWWELRACVYYDEFEKPKIVWPEIAKESRFGWDDGSYYYNKTCFIMPSEDFYLLGVLNSKLVWEFLLRTCPVLGDPDKKGRLTQQAVYVSQIPIKPIDENNGREVELRDKIIADVTDLLELNRRDQAARSDHDKELIARRIRKAEKEIDEMVEELYEVTV
jgi:hypothetical protein